MTWRRVGVYACGVMVAGGTLLLSGCGSGQDAGQASGAAQGGSAAGATDELGDPQVATSVYTDLISHTMAQTNYEVTAGNNGGAYAAVDYIVGQGLAIETAQNKPKIVNLRGKGYTDDPSANPELAPRSSADGLTIEQVQAAIKADLSGAVTVYGDVNRDLEVVFDHNPITSLQAQLAAAENGSIPTTTAGGTTACHVEIRNGLITNITDFKAGSAEFTLDAGQAEMPGS